MLKMDVLQDRSNNMEVTASSATKSSATRGTKRTAGNTSASKENAPPNSSLGKLQPKSLDLSKPAAGNKFGFRSTVSTIVPPATVPADQQAAKRRKTVEVEASAAASSSIHRSAPIMEEDLVLMMDDTGSVTIQSASLEPLILGPCDEIATLYRTTMMDDVLAQECKVALAGKISASKFDYKEKIGQLEAQMKSLRKCVSTLMKKQDSFLSDAQRIEINLNESLLREKQIARDQTAARGAVQDKLAQVVTLLKQTQTQRDKLIQDIKNNAATMNSHAQVLNQKEQEKQELQKNFDQTTKDLTEAMSMLDTTLAEREEAKRLLTDIQKEMDELQTVVHSLEEEKSGLMTTCQTQESDIELLKREKKEMESDLSAVREQYVQLMTQWSDLQKLNEKNEEVIQNLQAKFAASEQALQAAKKEVDDLKQQLLVIEQKSHESRSQTAQEFSAQKLALQRDHAMLQSEMEKKLTKTGEDLAAVKNELQQLEQSKGLLQEQYNKSQLELATVRSNLLHTSDKASSSDLEITKLTGELTLIKMQLEKKNEECFLTINNFGAVQKFHEERQTILQAEKEQLEKLKQELFMKNLSLESTLKATQGNLDASNNMLHEKTQAYDTMKAEFDRFQVQTKNDRTSWESQTAELKTQITNVTADFTSQLTQLTTELSSKTTSYEAKIADLTSKLTAESSKASNLHQELTSFKALSGVSSESQLENLVKLSMETELLRSQVRDKGELSETLMRTTQQLQDALRKIGESEMQRRQLHNTIQELKGNIRVFTRVRPMFHAGANAKDANGDVHMLQGDDAINAIEVSQDGRKLRLDNGTGAKSNYSFDAVWGPNATQKEIFEEISQLVQSALDGYHVCLFSYGQTGSGKTWTMTGSLTGEQRGIIPRSVEKVLEQSQNLSIGGWTYSLEASFLEIYNECIRDLLCTNSKDSDLDVKRDPNGRTTIPGLTRLPITNINDVTQLMTKAAKNRSTAATNMNERSSRSHSVFTLYLTASNPITKTTLSGSLNLCDLAGSERLDKSGAGSDAARLKETQSINKSLSSLSDVFLSLSQKSSHIPFRNSKLTYLLQPCLSGDGKTAMIVNLNPSLSSSGESACTLRFAAQVNQVELGKPKKSSKSGEEAVEAIFTPAASPTSSGSATARPSLSGSASTSSLTRPTATSGLKKPSSVVRPATAMRR